MKMVWCEVESFYWEIDFCEKGKDKNICTCFINSK